MTDRPKDKSTNVKPIRKDMKIQTEEETLKPIPALVELTQILHEMALSGEMRDFAYCIVNPEFMPCYGIAGEGANYALLYTQLDHLKTICYDTVVYPSLTGEWRYEDEE